MKPKLFSPALALATLAATLTLGAGARATTTPTAATPNAGSQGEFQPVAFSDSAEADMLRHAYRILASGDHDYKGHRAHAMHAVEAAAKLLGMPLHGDDKDRSQQGLSDEKLREAQGLIGQVLNSAAVNNQKNVVKHLNEAVNQINTALRIR